MAKQHINPHNVPNFLLDYYLVPIFSSVRLESIGDNKKEKTASKMHVTQSINYSTINIAFLSKFGSRLKPKLDILSHCNPNNGRCKDLDNEIKGCQHKAGAIDQQLIGDNCGNNYYNPSSADAKQVAAFFDGVSKSRPLEMF